MFTGIIEEVGRAQNLNNNKLKIFCSKVLENIKVGDSISVNGICLTVVEFRKEFFVVDVMPETIRKTSLVNCRTEELVNLERALKLGDRFGGHIISGHIDGIGRISNIRVEGNAVLLNIKAQNILMPQIVPKGSVALDGVSLTIVESRAENFIVSMIPHTRENTNFRNKHVGSCVNIETDILAKYVERLLNFQGYKFFSRGDKFYEKFFQ